MTKIIKANLLYPNLIILVLIVIACNLIQNNHNKSSYANITLESDNNGSSMDTIYKTKNLILVKLSGNSYQHISFLNTNDFGRVNCNGMLVINDKQALIFDTPADNESSEELLNYVSQRLKSKVIAIIPTHFHEDCVGGISVFNKYKIQSYASNRTIEFLKMKGNMHTDNMQGFNDSLILRVGNKKVISKFFGEGHTKDNIVGYFPADNVMFGGCLIKEIGAKKGNLEDANTKEWSTTVLKLKKEYPNANIIIPGHGKSGTLDLLDYTELLFK